MNLGLDLRLGIFIMFLALSGVYQSASGEQAKESLGKCSGILHSDQHGLTFGGGSGEEEGICIVDKYEEHKVLAICLVAQYCEVRGTVDYCADSGECVEIKNISSVSAEAEAATPALVAQQIPSLIDAYATKLELECAASLGNSSSIPQRMAKLVQSVTELSGGTIYVVDGSFTACGEGAPLCGTGGCPVGVFLVRGGGVRTMYMDQALRWNLSPSGKKIVMTMHGSVCGGLGPDPCETDIDLTTGKKRTFVPKS